MKNSGLSLFTILASLLLLSACAQNAKYAKLEPHEFTTLTCSGFLSWHDCRTEALSICPSGYYVADYLENYTIQRREISIACKT
jgi:hypothetical protein